MISVPHLKVSTDVQLSGTQPFSDMLMIWRDALSSIVLRCWVFCLFLTCFIGSGGCRKSANDGVPGAPHIGALRQETEDLFYHGFDNYMKHAFPEDELRPLSCKPLTRETDNPARLENDVLGNYSLTLIDSLSSLAILASSFEDDKPRTKPFLYFQDGVKALVELYGDGSNGTKGQGTRAKGFDLDSKVQVFETTIRGLGGLLSAHLFAVAELPIKGYNPLEAEVFAAQRWDKSELNEEESGIRWQNGFIYDGQLLRLAYNLGQRLVPAFWTSTGIPYPRVNLKYGIPFHANSAGNYAPDGQCQTEKTEKKEDKDMTENCSAGAGSLVLEFTVLSRLTGDPKFEELAKRAFWAIWNRRSNIDLIGSGIDSETGAWSHSWTGIGAGIDSFFEYALKTHILLAGTSLPSQNRSVDARDPRSLFGPLSDLEHSPASFLQTWDIAHAAIKHHIYRGTNFQHPHYIQVDLTNGAPRAFWVDALSAFYSGLLVLAGYVEEAIETHLTSTAIWARFSALPERYSMTTGGIEGGLGWWVGRPELIESTWYLYSATEDPWYIYVGEMILRDIKRRCWTPCGWAGLQDVVTGEKSDRMESFFLGETAKYLFLLFTPDHPLNKVDKSIVFTTEGHPLVIPRSHRKFAKDRVKTLVDDHTCPVKPNRVPFTISNVSARGDVYHAASLARLHLRPERGQIESVLTEYAAGHPSVTLADVQSPSNWTYYPWTLPLELVPPKAFSAIMPTAPTFELTFPVAQSSANANPPLQRVSNGIMINSLGGLRLSMVQDVPMFSIDGLAKAYRIQSINNIALGKDEKLYLGRNIGDRSLNPQDPLFLRTRDTNMLDVIVDKGQVPRHLQTATVNVSSGDMVESDLPGFQDMEDGAIQSAWNSLLAQISNLVQDASELVIPMTEIGETAPERFFIPATTPTGPGAAPLPDWPETSLLKSSDQGLPWTKIFAAGELCEGKLSANAVRSYEVILVRRGSCSFSQKLSNIPAIQPGRSLLQIVIIVDYEHGSSADINNVFGIGSRDDEPMIRPLLDEPQKLSSGLPRQNLVPMVMINGGQQTYQMLKHARGIGVKRRYSISSQGVPIANLMVV